MSAQHIPGGLPGKDPAEMSAVELQAVVYALRAQRDKLLAAAKLASRINPFGSVENAAARDAALAAIAAIASPAIQHLPSDDTEGGAV